MNKLDIYHHAREMAKQLATLALELEKSSQREWIDRNILAPKTDEGEKIIAYGGYVFECEFKDGCWCSIGGDDFTHWMPYFSPK